MKIEVEELVENYSNMIKQIAYQNVFNKSEAEDIMQDVFLKIIKNIKKINDEKHLKAWIIRVTINLSRDYNKSFWNKNTIAIDEDISYYDIETQGVFKELYKLEPKYRNIIYLYYYHGYKINEIASILEMNQNTVSSILTRARVQLRDVLEEGGKSNV